MRKKPYGLVPACADEGFKFEIEYHPAMSKLRFGVPYVAVFGMDICVYDVSDVLKMLNNGTPVAYSESRYSQFEVTKTDGFTEITVTSFDYEGTSSHLERTRSASVLLEQDEVDALIQALRQIP